MVIVVVVVVVIVVVVVVVVVVGCYIVVVVVGVAEVIEVAVVIVVAGIATLLHSHSTCGARGHCCLGCTCLKTSIDLFPFVLPFFFFCSFFNLGLYL